MKQKPLSLYVHIPFCLRKCTYCDFLSFAGMEAYYGNYVEKLIEEIELKSLNYREYKIKTVFIGGGTPTVIKTEQLLSIVNTIKSKYICDENMEITIEANPKTVNKKSLNLLSKHVGRISFGLQSGDNRLLKDIGRIHDLETFEQNFSDARNAGFRNINIDVMFALPNQSLADWENTLKYVISKGPEHVSAYGLMLEENTTLYVNVLNGSINLPDEEKYLKMYSLAKQMLNSGGYRQYEISNFAKPGFECKHNIVYWRCMEYVSFGLGASSYIDSFRFRNESNMGKYLSGGILQRLEAEKIEFNDAVSEFMFMGLRMTKGVSVNDFFLRFGISIKTVYGDTLGMLTEKGLIAHEEGRIFLTDKGVDISNYVFAELLI